MSNAIRFKHSLVARQPVEHARLKVVQGPDSGAIYVVTGTRASIGRGEENDIVIADLRASRVHAVLRLESQAWILEDQGSSNGILYQGKLQRVIVLKSGDAFSVGESTLEFHSAEEGTSILMAPPKSQEQLVAEQNQINLQEQFLSRRAKMVRGESLPNLMGGLKPSGGSEGNRKLILYLAFAGAAYFMFFTDDSTPTRRPGNATGLTKNSESSLNSSNNLAAYLPSTSPNKSAEILFRDGMREYFSGNYNRARTQFETVLQISPNHAMASLYLEKCSTSVRDEVKVQLSFAKKAMEAGKLRDARSRFDRVMRLLYKDQANPAYIESKEQYQKIVQQLKSEGGSGL